MGKIPSDITVVKTIQTKPFYPKAEDVIAKMKEAFPKKTRKNFLKRIFNV